MIIRNKIKGGFIAFVGYMLSPLSWWNDAFVNLPIAYFFASIVSYFSEELFAPAMIVGYWITNIAGLLMLHKGAIDIVSGERKKYTKLDFFKDLGISLIYTTAIVLLIFTGVLKHPELIQRLKHK